MQLSFSYLTVDYYPFHKAGMKMSIFFELPVNGTAQLKLKNKNVYMA